MITVNDIQSTLGLTGVVLTTNADDTIAITANEPVTPEMQARVSKWHRWGAVLPCPATVTALQFRRALNQLGLRAAVEAAVAQAPQDVRDAWEFAALVHRVDPALTALAAQLGQGAEAIDQIFNLADGF